MKEGQDCYNNTDFGKYFLGGSTCPTLGVILSIIQWGGRYCRDESTDLKSKKVQGRLGGSVG